jgi:hypothetical protein
MAAQLIVRPLRLPVKNELLDYRYTEVSINLSVRAMADSHESIRQFYQQKLENHDYNAVWVQNFWKDAQIGRLELLISGTGAGSDVFDTVEIESISQEVPQSIQSAFERHTWFSQHRLADIYVVGVSVEDNITYALLTVGYVHDGWDGFCQLIEVFDKAGDFVGAANFRAAASGREFGWSDQPFDSNTFPEMSPNITGEYALWSAEKASRIEKNGSTTRLILPWADFME